MSAKPLLDDRKLLFVYGTLKKGFCRHSALAGQELLATVSTESIYQLIDLGTYPGLIHDTESGQAIEGEIYQVDDRCMLRLDIIEGVQVGLYRRETITLDKQHLIAHEVISYFYLGDPQGFESAGTAWNKHT